ncbi:hypothetical protein SORBI_3003G014832 [Sorghum bicolor]|uniref:Uncharacterized protein n=2 Tax=Sorghum bicolor TaxID=4558 RepID=A0A1B6Q0T9_SORBI|nr:hypothetical protein SORBI_3003G014832 [Sorghum bicolor]
MFRLSFPQWHGSRHETNSYIAVYTLGGGGGWRQCSYRSRFHPIKSPAPVHIDGNIFVPAANLRARAARMFVLDVATETPRLYRIPYNYSDYHESWEMVADGFDLNGQMCLVVNVGFHPQPRLKAQFWVMQPPGEIEGKDDDDKLYWDLRYSFFLDGPFVFNRPRGVWIDHTQTLCYRVGNSVYSYNTRGGHSPSSNDVVDSLLFDQRLELPDSPCPSVSSCWLKFSRWSICGGYRPSLLSPLVFALPPSQDEKANKRPQFEHTLLRALRASATSKPNRQPTRSSDKRKKEKIVNIL